MTAKAFWIVCAGLFYSGVSAQNFTLPLWPDQIPNSRPTNEVEARDTSDVVRVSNVQIPDMAVFLPTKRIATGQAVLICPGGGYIRLVMDWEGTDVAKWLNSKGIAAVVLKSRLPISKNNVIPHLSPLLDAQRALRLVRFHAAEWNIDRNRIGVMGFSAGGHLASTVGTHFDDGMKNAADAVDSVSSRPDFMILMYPVITFAHPFLHIGSRNALLGESPDSSLIRYYSNELQVTTGTPPTFIVHAGDDKSVPVENTLMFYRALKDKGVPAEMHIYPEGGHGFSMAQNKGYLSSWTDRCADWLKTLK